MDLTVSRRYGSTLFVLTVALTAGSHSLMAANLLKATPSTATLASTTVNVRLAGTGAQVAVSGNVTLAGGGATTAKFIGLL